MGMGRRKGGREAMGVVGRLGRADQRASAAGCLARAHRHLCHYSHACRLFLAEVAETAAFATHKKYRLVLKSPIAIFRREGLCQIGHWQPLA
jgi:hypothetical protein